MDPQDAIQLLNNFAHDTFGIGAQEAFEERAGCYIGPGRGNNWMSPANIMNNLLREVNALLDHDQKINVKDLQSQAEDEEDFDDADAFGDTY